MKLNPIKRMVQVEKTLCRKALLTGLPCTAELYSLLAKTKPEERGALPSPAAAAARACALLLLLLLLLLLPAPAAPSRCQSLPTRPCS